MIDGVDHRRVDGVFDRAEHRRLDSGWLAEAWPRARVLAVHSGRVSALSDGPIELAGERLFLGIDKPPGSGEPFGGDESLGGDGPLGMGEPTPFFAVMTEVPEMTRLRDVLEGEFSPLERSLAVAAVALANWHESHRFHPRTGEPTVIIHGGWVRSTTGGDMTWPRTSPAILAFIHDGVAGEAGRCLLSRNVARPEGFRSVTAGFVEPGESLEQTVVRESLEELGVTVRDIRYYASESWPFADELMVGFTARADPEQPLVLDPTEIAASEWYTREQLRAGGPQLPSRISISRMMIDDWLDGAL